MGHKALLRISSKHIGIKRLTISTHEYLLSLIPHEDRKDATHDAPIHPSTSKPNNTHITPALLKPRPPFRCSNPYPATPSPPPPRPPNPSLPSRLHHHPPPILQPHKHPQSRLPPFLPRPGHSRPPPQCILRPRRLIYRRHATRRHSTAWSSGGFTARQHAAVHFCRVFWV
ncbi:hypothetical protein COCHEDRAFT_1201775, partial [Bipolaris maydis C5]